MTHETITYRRADLYGQVWKDPLRSVARAYDISDVWLGKVCRKLSVPLPGRGYWARKRAGWDPKSIPLPPIADGALTEITVPRRRQQVFLRRTLGAVGDGQPRPARPVISVPETLESPHKLVAAAAKLLRSRKPDDGFVSCWSASCLAVHVSPAALDRALRIMDALLRALEERGLAVEVTPALSPEVREQRRLSPNSGFEQIPDRATRVLVAGEWIQFAISEKSTQVQSTPEPPKSLKERQLESWLLWNRPTMKRVPNGVLELSLTNCEYLGIRTVWKDGDHQRVEKCLGALVAHLEIAAEAKKQDRLERERKHREWEDEQRRREEARARAREEAEREKRLEEDLRDWRQARDAREYAAEIRGLLASANGEVMEGWHKTLEWMEGYARRKDPLSPLRDTPAESPLGRGSQSDAED